jgi:hypothetical protein
VVKGFFEICIIVINRHRGSICSLGAPSVNLNAGKVEKKIWHVHATCTLNWHQPSRGAPVSMPSSRHPWVHPNLPSWSLKPGLRITSKYSRTPSASTCIHPTIWWPRTGTSPFFYWQSSQCKLQLPHRLCSSTSTRSPALEPRPSSGKSSSTAPRKIAPSSPLSSACSSTTASSGYVPYVVSDRSRLLDI